jgi:two-component system response regulator AtoC
LTRQSHTQNELRAPLHERLIGRSPAIEEVNELIRRFANVNLTVLVNGETGTGKDIAARLLHKLSGRYGKPFVKVNCPAIPEEILESELFGYERGAFTGARNAKPGRFELADGGTLFLDEICDTSISVQSKLLQVLDGEPFLRVGGSVPIHCDVRIVAATNVNLDEAMAEGRLRPEVRYRLEEVVVHLPSLRERLEDLPVLAEHFNFNYCKQLNRAYVQIPEDALKVMQQHAWPGNVRELASRVKQFVTTGDVAELLEETPGITVEKVPRAPANGHSNVNGDGKDANRAPVIVPLKEATRRAVEQTERALIEETLRYTLWNRRKAAKLLQVSYSSLLRRIDAYNIGKS